MFIPSPYPLLPPLLQRFWCLFVAASIVSSEPPFFLFFLFFRQPDLRRLRFLADLKSIVFRKAALFRLYGAHYSKLDVHYTGTGLIFGRSGL